MVLTSAARAGNSAQEGNLSSELLGTKTLLGVPQQAQEQLLYSHCFVLSQSQSCTYSGSLGCLPLPFLYAGARE